jgi:diacylglycerol kinase (ATP)
MGERFSVRARLESFRHAGAGVRHLVATQHNARIHLAFTLAVVTAGGFFGVSRLEWCALVLAIGLVWVAEAFNTALENLSDAAHPDPHPLVGRAKDVAAGGVLFAAIASVAIGLLVLGPHLLAWLGLGGDRG